jgi:drug/metabolite transporter (DMT)-like permease
VAHGYRRGGGPGGDPQRGVGQGDVDGDLLALAGATCFAGYLTVSRAARPADMTPAIGIGGAGAALAGLVAGGILVVGAVTIHSALALLAGMDEDAASAVIA